MPAPPTVQPRALRVGESRYRPAYCGRGNGLNSRSNAVTESFSLGAAFFHGSTVNTIADSWIRVGVVSESCVEGFLGANALLCAAMFGDVFAVRGQRRPLVLNPLFSDGRKHSVILPLGHETTLLL